MATVHQFSRRAVAGDLPAILRVDHVAASGDRERAEFLRRSVDLGECRVYVAGEVVAGFVVVQPAHFFGRDFIELLVVDPDSPPVGHRPDLAAGSAWLLRARPGCSR